MERKHIYAYTDAAKAAKDAANECGMKLEAFVSVSIMEKISRDGYGTRGKAIKLTRKAKGTL